MIEGLLIAHSVLRYFVLIAGAAALVYLLIAVATNRPLDRASKGTTAAFSGLLQLQVLLGFVLLVSGRFYPQLIGHIFMMLAAAAAIQVPLSVLRRRPPEQRGPMPLLVGTVVALALIWGGVLAIGRNLLTNSF